MRNAAGMSRTRTLSARVTHDLRRLTHKGFFGGGAYGRTRQPIVYCGGEKAGFREKGEGELITLLGMSFWRQVKEVCDDKKQ